MQAPAADTARAILDVNLPKGGLPLILVGVLLVGYFAVIVYAISKASAFKAYSQDFPTQAAPVVVALVLTLLSAPVYLTLIALGIGATDGSGQWLAFLATLAGVAGVGGLAVKRFSSPEYQQGKATVEAAKAAAAPPQVNVQGGANINATNETAIPVVVPQGGVKPRDPAIVAAVETAAKNDPRLPSPLDDERD